MMCDRELSLAYENTWAANVVGEVSWKHGAELGVVYLGFLRISTLFQGAQSFYSVEKPATGRAS